MKEQKTKILIKIIIGLGVFIRLYQFFVNRSLYHDEALLARNINDLSFGELTGILEFNQAAPFAFLWLTKVSVMFLGNIEYAFRLIPLIAGITSIFLFYKISKNYFKHPFLLIALAFFAFNNHLIFYSISFKQYGIDAFLGLLITYALYSFKFQTWRHAFFLGLFGAISIYFSQPSIFFLASLGIVLSIKYLTHSNFDSFKKLAFSGSIWVLSFGIYFFVFLRPSLASDFLQNYHLQYYMPLSFWKWESWTWYVNSFINLYSNPTDIHFAILGAVFGVLGIAYGIWKKDLKYLFLMLPIILAFGASAFGKYSTIPRLMLFATPAFVIFMVKGIDIFYQKLGNYFPKYSMPITLVICGVLILQSFLNSAIHQTAKPKRVENIKALLRHIEAQKQPNDILYLYYHTEAQFGYYEDKYDLQNLEIIYGHNPYDELWGNDFENLKDKGRIWILMMHYKRLDGTLDNQVYANKLNQFCSKMDEINEAGGVLFLYNCSSKQHEK